jgi:hypothetical protein
MDLSGSGKEKDMGIYGHRALLLDVIKCKDCVD